MVDNWTTYYAIRVDSNTIKVASSQANANAGTALSLSGTPSGFQFFIGVTATVTVGQTGGVIDTITVTNPGTGYGNAPQITITDAAGSGEQLSAVVGFSVDSVAINDGGLYRISTNSNVYNDAG